MAKAHRGRADKHGARWRALPALLACLFSAGAVAAAPPPAPRAPVRLARTVVSPKRALATRSASIRVEPDPVPWATTLPALAVDNRNTGAHGTLRLYTATGTLDLAACRAFMTIAVSAKDADVESEPLDTRLLQLAARAAYHFGGKALTIVSATRKGAHGKHGTGEALDFKLDGVSAAELAAYLRTYPRAGVGIYTHPKTQYVHLDVRDHSYHWVDASPPGVTWREALLPDPKQAVRDAAYDAWSDLPEAAKAKSAAF